MYSSPGKYEHGAAEHEIIRKRTPKYAAGGDMDKTKRNNRKKEPSKIKSAIITFILLVIITTITKFFWK